MNYMEALLGILHETGHALYEMGLPADWRMQPVGEARGMGVHESQSLFVEMQVSRSHAFMRFALPLMRSELGLENSELTADMLYQRASHVRRSFIRVNADEVTYPAHVILRYELEKALLNGDLPPSDLPGAWGEGMEELLGIRPDSDANGCLQDIHWPEGIFGYFPSYTMGALIAAQLREAMEQEIGSIDNQVERGDFEPIRSWLRTHIHSQGSRYYTEELLKRATGSGISVDPYKRHITRRYIERVA
jgi:carboxypeptidase Taq